MSHPLINTVLIIIVFFYVIIKPLIERITFEINRTFWEKKPYGFHFTLWDYPVKEDGSNSGTSFFGFNWRDPDKIHDDIKKSK